MISKLCLQFIFFAIALSRLVRCDDNISVKCYSGEIKYDECGRKCRCIEGKLARCCRIRREFISMTYNDRVRYINTAKTASMDPKYKQLIAVHRALFSRGHIHTKEFFLPWHRWFILQYENLLQDIDCRVTLSYWDWSRDANNPFSSDLWNPGPHGFGGDGNSGCVITGPFRASVWSLATGGCLDRNFSSVIKIPGAKATASLMTEQFKQFKKHIITHHASIHTAVGGTMRTNNSASSPEFFLLHGFVDKLWWNRQTQGDVHKINRAFMEEESQMPSTEYRPRDFVDLHNQLNGVCADYMPSPSNAMYKGIQEDTYPGTASEIKDDEEEFQNISL